MTYQINLPYTCYSIEVYNGSCSDAAPVARWLEGKSLEYIETWVKSKKGTIKQVDKVETKNIKHYWHEGE